MLSNWTNLRFLFPFMKYSDVFQPFPKQQILDPSKLKVFADDNFERDENGRKFPKRVENLMFSKDLHCRHVKTRACLRKAYWVTSFVPGSPHCCRHVV